MEDLLVVKNLVQEFKSHSGFLDSIKLKDGRLIREKKAVHAVNDVSFTIRKGETFGLVGESGCGKSTTAKSIIRLLDCVSGQIIYKDQDISRLKNRQLEPYRKSVQMIFQDPQSSLDPRQQVKDIIMEPMLFHKIAASRKEAEERCLALLERVGLRPEQANRYPHQFSGGQRQRVAVARALAMEPKIILADEPVSALDKSVQAQVLNLFHDLQKEFGISIIFISHDLSVVEYMSDHIAVLYLGEVIEYSTSEELYHNPRHPYTKELLRSIPQISGDARLSTANREPPIELPSPIRPPSGCRYHPRCPYRTENCSKHIPAPALVGRDHIVKCHRCAAQNQPIEPMEGSLI